MQLHLPKFLEYSGARGPPQFQEKRSRSEKAILGALGEFRAILGATLGVQKIMLGMRNPVLGMASRDLCNAKTTVLGATPKRFPELMGTHMKDFHLPMHSRRFFSNIGVVPRLLKHAIADFQRVPNEDPAKSGLRLTCCSSSYLLPSLVLQLSQAAVSPSGTVAENMYLNELLP